MNAAPLAAQLRHVVEAATLAPSVHNTQPWRFALLEDGFELRADRERQLRVLDPEGRQLHLSCGAALATARVAARALGLDPHVELLPVPDDPDLLARLRVTPGSAADDAELALALAVLSRHTTRDAFLAQPLPAGLLAVLRGTAEDEGALLRQVRAHELVELEVLLSAADAAEERDPAYRAELAAWVHDAEAGDGVPPEAAPSPAGRGSSLRLRDFTLSGAERSTGDAPAAERPEVVVLSTMGDGSEEWLRAGQALGMLLLRAAAAGVQGQPLGQVTDLPGPRRQLAAALGLVGIPQLVLRLGVAHARAATARRATDEVLLAPQSRTA